LKKPRSVKDRAETVYWQAGGKKENLKKAILHGKGNKDKKVPLSGLDGLDNVYADQDEYNIIYSDDIEGLGEIASGTAIAAATSAVAAIAGALKQVKGLFNKGGSDEKSFQSETDNAGSASSAPTMIPEDEDAFRYEESAPSTYSAPATTVQKQSLATRSYAPAPTATAPTIKTNETTKIYSTPAATTQPVLSNESSSSGAMLVPSESTSASDAVQTQDGSEKAGILQKTTTWVKANPGKSLLVAGGIITGGILLMRAMRGGSGTNGLEGVPPKKKKAKSKTKSGSKNKKEKVKAQNLL
jgi:hypothetical protein